MKNCNPHQVLGPSVVPSTCGVLLLEEKWKDNVWRTHSCWTTTCSCNWVLQEHCLKLVLFTLKPKNCTCVCQPLTFQAQKDKFFLTLFLRFFFTTVVKIWWYNKLISLCCLVVLFLSAVCSTMHWVSVFFFFFQSKRLGALNKFKSKDRSLLIATDVASRGLDIPHVDVVINFDIPTHSKVNMLTLNWTITSLFYLFSLKSADILKKVSVLKCESRGNSEIG